MKTESGYIGLFNTYNALLWSIANIVGTTEKDTMDNPIYCDVAKTFDLEP